MLFQSFSLTDYRLLRHLDKGRDLGFPDIGCVNGHVPVAKYRPDASVGSNLYTSAAFGQTCCATVSTASARAIIQTGESARVVQFALKVLF